MVSVGLISTLIMMLFLKAPVIVAMGTSVAVGCWLGDLPLYLIAQGVIDGSMSWSLLSIFFFMMAGNIMGVCGVADQIFSFANACVGHWPGGLAHVNCLCSMVFAGISGAAAADCAALGPIEIKSMTYKGYDLRYSTGITLASSMVGPIIPPSVFFIMFGVVTNTSIAKLFIAGIVPGVVISLALMLVCARISIRRPDIFPRGSYTPMKERWRIFKKSVWSLLAPVIIVIGMTSGSVSPTEAGVVAVLYSLLLGAIYRTLKWNALWNAVRDSMIMAASSLILFGFASTMSYILTMEMLPTKLATLILSLTQNKYLVLFLIDLLLLVLGCFMSASSAMILLTPILLPLMEKLGVSTIQLGVLMCFALTIGIATPPVGMGLYILADITHQKIEEVFEGFMPFFPALVVMLIVLTLVPQISTWLPNLLMP
ncbi:MULTISPECIES: TRAP transporter large permease [unclassified Pyramidobacter]|uniref:TRAP transporter large permease n=1 Tax=unclassified Pyramidobacter TaxID=2632171 RepID=UPI00098F9B97|nr:TRAP transporter large permease [Pyramidobacter sp. C12-8]OON90097.1 hypothetical protein B0D78_00460 [Pyramidobacter sp. C12-8]